MNWEVRALLGRLAEKAPWERGHAERVAVYATAAAFRLGFTGDRLVEIRIAAELHDIGKIVAAGRQDHPAAAEALLGAFPATVREIVRHHHERLDGSGYPDGLSGPAVGRGAQVVGAAEWFDVARHGSPFSEARTLESVRAELTAKAGVWFETEVIEALLEVQRVIQPVGT
ncbi:MAG: HD-GYP domain-containing protein [Fimbriimonas sp.]